uniref:MARVEL domain-containing protein n=1 Tax=Acrobeloides nanus TaxID=290746 RepID=A0A914CV55_9BILA
MLASLLIILFLIDGRVQWSVYTAIFVITIILLITTFLTLIVYFFRIHVQTKNQLPWVTIELLFNLVACVTSLVFAGILMYDVIKMYKGEFHHHKYVTPPNIGAGGWRTRILVVMITEIFNAIFYGISMVRTRQYGIL